MTRVARAGGFQQRINALQGFRRWILLSSFTSLVTAFLALGAGDLPIVAITAFAGSLLWAVAFLILYDYLVLRFVLRRRERTLVTLAGILSFGFAAASLGYSGMGVMFWVAVVLLQCCVLLLLAPTRLSALQGVPPEK